MDAETKNSGFEIVWSVWNRRKWLALLVFGASFSAVVSAVIFLPDVYKSTATVLVETERVPETFIKPAVTGEVDTRLQSINQQILSRSRLKALIERVGLYPELKQASIDDVVTHMRRNVDLEVKSVEKGTGHRETISFALSFRGKDPRKVSLVTNTLASFFIEENWKARGRQASETAEFLRIQLQDMRKRLDEQEARVAEVRKTQGGETPLRMHASLLALERMSARLRLNSERLTRALDRREVLARQLGDASLGDPLLGPISKEVRLMKLRRELSELRTRYTDQYPDVIRLRAEIAAVERMKEGKPEEAGQGKSDPTLGRSRQALNELDAEIQELRSEEKRLQQAITAYQQKMENVSLAEEPSDVVRDYETTKDLYSSLLKRYADARQAEELEQRQKDERFRILDAALLPRHAVAPNRLLLSLIGLVLSLGLAVGAVIVAEQIDTSFHSVDDLRAFTKVPVLISIPNIVTEKDVEGRSQRFRLGLAAAAVGLMLIVSSSYYVAHENEELVRIVSRQRS